MCSKCVVYDLTFKLTLAYILSACIPSPLSLLMECSCFFSATAAAASGVEGVGGSAKFTCRP